MQPSLLPWASDVEAVATLIIVVGLICIEMIVWCKTTHTPDPIVESVLDSNVISVGETRFPSVDYRSDCTTLTFRDLMKNLIIRPCEIFNTGWLAYIVLAQVFRAYQTCDCMASL